MECSFKLNPMLEKVISGGQTGMDQAGLEAAKMVGIPTGGTAPKYFMTENGPDSTLEEYGLVECEDQGYVRRTMLNVANSDATVLFGDMGSAGSAQTIRYCKLKGKPYITNPTAEQLVEFIIEENVKELNVAGNRASRTTPTKLLSVKQTLVEAFQKCLILKGPSCKKDQ